MPDKKCPNCGVWNSQAARLCDCGFDFALGAIPSASHSSRLSSTRSLLTRAALYGVLGALVAAVPVSAFKTLAFIMGICVPLAGLVDGTLSVTRCGILYYPSGRHPLAFPIYSLVVLLVGALVGVASTAVVMRWPYKRRRGIPLFWLPFTAAVILDALFVFIILYPGQ